MMLYVPVNVIDTVPSIKEYIETGRSVSEAAEQSVKDQEKQTKTILGIKIGYLKFLIVL